VCRCTVLVGSSETLLTVYMMMMMMQPWKRRRLVLLRRSSRGPLRLLVIAAADSSSGDVEQLINLTDYTFIARLDGTAGGRRHSLAISFRSSRPSCFRFAAHSGRSTDLTNCERFI